MRRTLPLRTLRCAITACKQLLKIIHPQASSRPLWLNKRIKYQSNAFFMSSLIDSGIFFHQDLLDINGEYLQYDALANKFNFQSNNRDFVKFIKLISSLPEEWDAGIATTSRSARTKTLKVFIHQHNSTKTVYEQIQRTIIFTPRAQLEWHRTLSCGSARLPWESIYRNLYNATIENKLRSFQIKLNLGAIVTNDSLYSFGKIESNKCTFCKNATENVYHLFCLCPVTCKYWENVTAWLSMKLRISLIFSAEQLLFGVHNDEPCKTFVNCVLLCARYVIYQCKYAESPPTMLRFFAMLCSVRTSERYSAVKRGSMSIHKSKWSFAA